MNKHLIALQMLGISLVGFSQLFCVTEDPLSDNERRREIIGKLAQDMTENGKSQVSYAIALLPTEHLHAFEYTVNILTQRMWDFEKGRAVFSLIDMFQKNFDETSNAFTDMTLQQLDKLVSPREIDKLITVLSKMEPNLWQAEITQLINKHKDKFETMVNHLIQGVGVDEYYKHSVMSALTRISAWHLGAIRQIAYELTQKMTQENKANVICILAEVPVERLNGFKTTVDSLTQGMNEYDKKDAIGILAYLIQVRMMASAEQFADFANVFSNETLQELIRYVPSHERSDLIRNLATMQPDQWQAEITRVINEYRHGNAAQPWVNPMEIHNYARTQVTTSSSNSASHSSSSSSSSSSSVSSKSMRLDDAVIENMNERLQQSGIDPIDFADAKMLLEQWIEAKYSNSSLTPVN